MISSYYHIWYGDYILCWHRRRVLRGTLVMLHQIRSALVNQLHTSAITNLHQIWKDSNACKVMAYLCMLHRAAFFLGLQHIHSHKEQLLQLLQNQGLIKHSFSIITNLALFEGTYIVTSTDALWDHKPFQYQWRELWCLLPQLKHQNGQVKWCNFNIICHFKTTGGEFCT